MAIIRQFAAVLKKNCNSRVISSRLPLEIALFALKHMAKINTQYLLSLFHHANCYSTFIFENKL